MLDILCYTKNMILKDFQVLIVWVLNLVSKIAYINNIFIIS